MTEQETDNQEMSKLVAKAAELGVKHHPNIGLEKLRDKIEHYELVLAAGDVAHEVEKKLPEQVETESAKRRRIKSKATELILVNITCMNPSKREWQGEYFTAGNSLTGTIRKMVPFGVDWHVPRMLLNMIKQRKYQMFFENKDAKGNKTRKGKLISEFNIVELPKLTPEELKELAQRQAMAGGSLHSD